MQPGEILMTVEDVAKRLQVAATTVRDEIKRGRLTVSRVGALIRVSEEQLQAYLNRGPETPRARTTGNTVCRSAEADMLARMEQQSARLRSKRRAKS